MEYAEDRADIVREFARILKPNGKISIVKHNRAGRVMQMVVLLNDLHKDADWQDKMVEIKMRVSDMEGYKGIAFFHHLVIEKK